MDFRIGTENGMQKFEEGWEASFAGNYRDVEKSLRGLDLEQRASAIRAISDTTIRVRVARGMFGEKTADDIGLVSTMDHPNTDYGEPKFSGVWDLGEK